MTASPLTRPLPRRLRPRVTPLRPTRLVVMPPPARHPLLWVVSTILVLATAVFGAVMFNALAADDSVRARVLQAEVRAAEVRYGQLLADVAALEAPARIEAAAAELGLVRVDNPRQLRVSRALPADGAATARPHAGDRPDRLKPLLSNG